MIASASKSRLPAGLQEVEYLESTGVQYLFLYDEFRQSNVAYTVDFQYVSYLNNYQAVAGGNGIELSINSKGHCKDFYVGTSEHIATFERTPSSKKVMIDGNTVLDSGSTWYWRGITIFSSFYGSGRYLPSIVRIMSYSLSVDDFMMQLVPCYTTTPNWTNELGNMVPIGTKGMYDLVNKVLYTNRQAGVDDFIAGPDVN